MTTSPPTAGRRGPDVQRAALVVTWCALAVFALGLVLRTGSDAVALLDVGVYNVVFGGAAVVCLCAAARRRRERAVWAAVAASLLLTTAGNLLYSLVVARLPVEPSPSAADLLYLAAYPALCVALVAVIRVRVRRFPPSLWLDGLIGGLSAVAVAVAVLLAPSLEAAGDTGGDALAAAVALAYPVADVVLLAVLVGVGAALGLRRDRAVLLVGLALAAMLAGDVVYLGATTDGGYLEGGPLDLTWLTGAALLAAAARTSPPPPDAGAASATTRARERSRMGWQVLVLPVAGNALSLLLLGAGWGDRFPDLVAWCATSCVALAVVRTSITLHEVRSFHDVSERAYTDDLTGLANRRALLDAVGRSVTTAGPDRPTSVLLMDLDGFKAVNDDLGHHAGDQLLRVVATRLLQVLPATALAARLGGDEFAVLLPGADPAAARTLARAVRAAVRRPVALDAGTGAVQVDVSVGTATAPADATSPDTLIRCADVAMYHAKTSRTGVHTYREQHPAPDMRDLGRPAPAAGTVPVRPRRRPDAAATIPR